MPTKLDHFLSIGSVAAPARLIERRLPQPEPTTSAHDTAGRLLILLVLYAIPSIVIIGPVIDPDIWWHLRTGEWIVQHGTVPTHDPFSLVGQTQHWVAYSWLFEVLTYGLYKGLGLWGIVLYRVAMVFSVVAAIHHFVAKREPRFIIATGLVGVSLLPIANLMSERPWLFTVLFFTITLDVILDLRAGRNRRTIWLLPLVYALWANLHIQFIHGLFILVLACVSPLVDRFFGLGKAAERDARDRSRTWRYLVVLALACLLATLLNPYHWRLYAVVVQYATQLGAYNYVMEHLGMDFREPWNWALLALTLSATFALGRRPTVSSFDVLLLLAAAYFSFHSRRDLWFMVLTALGILTTSPPWDSLQMEKFKVSWRQAAILVVGIVVMLVAIGWWKGIFAGRLGRSVSETFPVDAVSFVERKGYPGPLFNDFDWGGYLIWGIPRLKVAMDGRTNLYGDERLSRSMQTWQGQYGWDSDPDLNAAGVVIAHSKEALTSLLRRDPHFELVYEDQLAVVFVSPKK